MHVNDNIKLIRELSGLTQAQFAKLIKTNLSNLKTYENTNVKPKAFVTFNVSLIAGVPIEDMENKKLKAGDIKIDRKWLDDLERVEKVEKSIAAGEFERTGVSYERLIEQIEARRLEAKEWAERAEAEKKELLSIIKDNLTALLSNSAEVKGNMADAIIEMQSEHRAIMDTLDKIAKQPVGTTVGRADILEDAAQEGRKKTRRNVTRT